MPVYLHPATLIIDKEIIQRYYKGALPQFREDFNTDDENYHQEDAELFALAAMNEDEFNFESLEAGGLSQTRDEHYTILSRLDDPSTPKWLKNDRVFAWHVSASPISIAKAQKISETDMDELQRMRDEDGIEPLGVIWF
jgi:hypothetical protein